MQRNTLWIHLKNASTLELFGRLNVMHFVNQVEGTELKIYDRYGKVNIEFKYQDQEKYKMLKSHKDNDKGYIFKIDNNFNKVFSCDWTSDVDSLKEFIKIIDAHSPLGKHNTQILSFLSDKTVRTELQYEEQILDALTDEKREVLQSLALYNRIS